MTRSTRRLMDVLVKETTFYSESRGDRRMIARALRWARSKRERLTGRPVDTLRWFADLDDAIKELEGR